MNTGILEKITRRGGGSLAPDLLIGHSHAKPTRRLPIAASKANHSDRQQMICCEPRSRTKRKPLRSTRVKAVTGFAKYKFAMRKFAKRKFAKR
jgi:hypothetical protein